MPDHNYYARNALVREARKLFDFDPQAIIHKKFLFTAENSSHEHALVGTITGLSWSDEGGLEVFVSIPRLWGCPLRSIMFTNDSWAARIEIDEEPYRRRLEQLPDDDSPEIAAEAEEISNEQVRARFIYGKLSLLPS